VDPSEADTKIEENAPVVLTEAEACDLAWKAVESVGGTRSIYRHPRMAYARNAKRDVEVDGHSVEIRYGEIATPAIATVEEWVFQINDDDIELLMAPVKRRQSR
jgi:hypothetical protein